MTIVNVEWVNPNFARLSLPSGEQFAAARSAEDGWRTVGLSVTDGWAFPQFEGLLSFIQERVR